MDKRENQLFDDCFAQQKFMLKLLGLKTSESILYRIYGLCLLIVLTTYSVLIIPEFFKMRQDLDQFVYCTFVQIGHITILITYIYVYWNRLKIEQVFEKVKELDDLSNCDNGINGYDFMFRYKNLIRKQSYFGCVLAGFVILSCTTVSFILSVKKGEWLLPFGVGIDLNNNIIKYITNIMSTGIYSPIYVTVLFLYVNVFTFICGHCKLFRKYLILIMNCRERNSLQESQNQNHISNSLQTFNSSNDVVDWETVKIKLRKLVPYHVCIYETGAEIENCFCMIVLVWFGGLSICSCLLLYHITIVNILSYLGIRNILLLLVVNCLLLILSVWGEQVITESSKIADVCYELDFVGVDLRIQKSLLLIMRRAQRPIVPTIGKFKLLGLTTMLGVLQSTYSYYTILRNLTSK